jgi:S-adenosylmethionine:tRNA ribosyltransferase-isomerase
MRLDEFDYDLPAHLIAQEPWEPRDQARLLVVHRAGGTLDHHVFLDLPDLLRPGDLLVLNDTRVLPARLLGRRARTGGRWEGLFLREFPDGTWELLCQTRGRLTEGETILVVPPISIGGCAKPQAADGEPLPLRLLERTAKGYWRARPERPGSAVELLQAHGRVPLPPYVRGGQAVADDQERYQTVFARRPGAVAAPTAGLHFTPRVFERLRDRGIGWTFVTLHVGAGTFQPIRSEDITAHRMHQEWGELTAPAAAALAECQARKGRVVAVGTTSVRVLETAAASGPLRTWSGQTGLYIYPPYPFRAVDALITNFHLPRTSLLVLVSAFAGVDLIRRAYQAAKEREYRFYSYGDAMLID